MGDQRHRSGSLKQQNKSHKHGKHKSKGAIQSMHKGRVALKVATRKQKALTRKEDRRNQVRQQRKHKRALAMEEKRSKGGLGGCPHIIVVIPLHNNVSDLADVLTFLLSADKDAVVHSYPSGRTLMCPKMKQRFTLVSPPYSDLYCCLDTAKVADTLLFVYSASHDPVDSFGDLLLTSLFAQGLPASSHIVQGLDQVPLKQRGALKKLLQQTVEKRFPKEKIQQLDSGSDGAKLLRLIGMQKSRHVTWRDRRPHLLAEQVQFEHLTENTDYGTLHVSGYLRGQSLSVNGLVHLPGIGDFHMSRIEGPRDPCPIRRPSDVATQPAMQTEEDVGMEEDVKVLQVANPAIQESLQSEVIPDPMEGEQTWPTDDELKEAEAHGEKRGATKRVPEGMSDYQAAWIVDSGDESGSEESVHGSELMEQLEITEDSHDEDVDDIMSTVTEQTAGDTDENYDQNYNEDEERKQLEKMKAEKEEEHFPDEMDTPIDMSARTRFAKYRGLKSFRTSPWDAEENLPPDYARIFQFDNFNRTKKRVLSHEIEDAVLPGWYVTICISNVPCSWAESNDSSKPLVVFGLLQHEQKMSVLHYVVKRHPSYTAPIKSKERLIFHNGLRRFSSCPVFSQHTSADKHKFERFLRTDTVSVATVFAPITFPPIPTLLFTEDDKTGERSLVATGSLYQVNPNRMVIRKVVLTGHPFKIHKKSAVIRYMFFDRADIQWFKPVDLHTKYGRRGHIKEPLGTHGHMKCVFDGQLKAQDTVCMNLYKRVFPKWTYEPVTTTNTHPHATENTDMS